MPFRPRLVPPLVASLIGLGGCSFVSPDVSAPALKANADTAANFRIATPPESACSRTARMLMWCAGGPNFHYRCDTQPGGNRAELTGTLEAIYRTEYFMVTEFVRDGSDTKVTVRQRESVLLYDYAPMIERYFTNPDCQPR